jgi:hypothetical protein
MTPIDPTRRPSVFGRIHSLIADFASLFVGFLSLFGEVGNLL